MNIEKIELIFIVVESISILVEIGLQLYQIKSSKDSEQKILLHLDNLEK